MKRLLALLIVLTVFLPTSTAVAQNTNNVGLGISLHTSGLTTSFFGELDAVFSPVNVYVPISLSGFRIEPELGLFRISESDDESSYTQSMLQIGTGLFATRDYIETLFYFGGRVGLLLNTSSDEFEGEFADETERSRTNLYLAPALGAEHFFGDHFSLGGEAQLMYLRAGNEEVDGETGDESDGSMLRTRALLFVRWYF